jgi:hypothetical protein
MPWSRNACVARERKLSARRRLPCFGDEDDVSIIAKRGERINFEVVQTSGIP